MPSLAHFPPACLFSSAVLHSGSPQINMCSDAGRRSDVFALRAELDLPGRRLLLEQPEYRSGAPVLAPTSATHARAAMARHSLRVSSYTQTTYRPGHENCRRTRPRRTIEIHEFKNMNILLRTTVAGGWRGLSRRCGACMKPPHQAATLHSMARVETKIWSNAPLPAYTVTVSVYSPAAGRQPTNCRPRFLSPSSEYGAKVSW